MRCLLRAPGVVMGSLKGLFPGASCLVHDGNRHGVDRPIRTSFARFICLAGLLFAPVTRAQHVFVVLEDGGPQVVRDVRYKNPQIEVDGKLQSAEGTQFALRDAAIYGPGLITVSDFQVGTRSMEIVGSSGSFNLELRIRGLLQSETDLKQCFVVLDVKSGGDKGVIYAELTNLAKGKARRVDLRFPLSAPLEKGAYELHFFSEGFEILHSRMKAAFIEEQKQKTTDFLNRPSNRSVKLVHAVKPQYPDGLPDGESPGSAKVRCHIDTEGKVAEATLIECSHPAFGEAALAAVQQWTFEPEIKNHEPVATTVDIPFEFKPPIQANAAETDSAPAPNQ